MINDHFEGDDRFTVLFKSVAQLGGPNEGKFQAFGKEAARQVGDTLRAKLRPGVRPARLAGDGEPTICYAAQPNSLVIRTDGTVGKCTVALDHPLNAIGRLSSNGSLYVDQDRFRFWIRGLASGDPEEVECPMQGIPAVESPRPTPSRGAK